MQGDYGREGYDLDKAFARKTSPPPVSFEEVWPSETRGDGAVVKNNLRDGSAQGKGSMIRKAHCRLCGFPNDLTAIDHNGGSLDGNGGVSITSTATATITLPNGTVHTEKYGNATIGRNSGCANCGSKNSTSQRVLLTMGNPWNRVAPLGF